MNTKRRSHFFHLLMLCTILFMAISSSRADLKQYVTKPDSSYKWELQGKESVGGATIYKIHLVSQTWQKIVWEHALYVYQPNGVKPNAVIALYNTGGNPGAANNALALELAKRSGIPVAFLYNIPNQPLLEGKSEDALIAETFVRYLKTGDEEWPLLFPMVKSVVRAMDALQAFSKEQWKTDIMQFVVGGASKRGWTAWLTAATGDKRVKAIFPMVIDMLNMPKQQSHQREAYGALSAQIGDYERAGLTGIFEKTEGKRLTGMVDPYSYRQSLTLPKLLVLGANDPYWTADSLQLYYDALPGQTFVSISPNAGHGLTVKGVTGMAAFARPVQSISAFLRAQIGGAKLPNLVDRRELARDGNYRLTLRWDKQPTQIRLWVAKSKTRDFRQSLFEEVPVDLSLVPNVPLIFNCALPADGFIACFAEADFGTGDALYSLCAPVRVLDKNGMVLPH